MKTQALRMVPDTGATSNTAASEAASKTRRIRTSRPKVKTGCTNCKHRRIKCDERRPSCTHCVRSNRICTGYPPPSRSARPHEVLAIAPKPQPDALPLVAAAPTLVNPTRRNANLYPSRITPPTTPVIAQPNPVTLYRPSSELFCDQQEGLYFQLFREHTASELSGFFDSVFWSRSVLQLCHSEAAIRHAVVALGALYKTLEKSCESPPGSPSDNDRPIDHAYRHWEVAVKQYSHALTSLVAVDSQDQKSHRTRLMASVLLACFDSFVGDHRQAIKQIQTGLGLLEQLRAERRRSFSPAPGEPVEEELVQMFTRLAIQAKSYDMAFHFPHPYVIHLTPSHAPGDQPPSPLSDAGSPPSTTESSIPERFASAIEARVAWDTLCERMLRFMEMMFAHAKANANSNGPMGVLPASLIQYGMGFKGQIEAWSNAFDHLLASRTAPSVSSQEKAGIAVLKMFQINVQILFLMTYSDSEAQFDAFQMHFKKIVELAVEVVGDEERRAAAKRCPDPQMCPHHKPQSYDMPEGHEYVAHHIKPSFSADLGIVPPLYVVATKCRDPALRRQAIQLLRSSSRREAMWDSELTARIGMWITEVEEGDDLSSPAAATPEPGSGSSQLSPRPSNAIEFGEDVPLGPGGNARWDARRESQGGGLAAKTAKRPIPEEKRVMVRAVEFDLRERVAFLQIGNRRLPTGAHDTRSSSTKIIW